VDVETSLAERVCQRRIARCTLCDDDVICLDGTFLAPVIRIGNLAVKNRYIARLCNKANPHFLQFADQAHAAHEKKALAMANGLLEHRDLAAALGQELRQLKAHEFATNDCDALAKWQPGLGSKTHQALAGGRASFRGHSYHGPCQRAGLAWKLRVVLARHQGTHLVATEDEVAIVTYAGSAGVLLKPTKVSDKSVILEKINALTSGGSTAGHAGLKGAYELADEMTGDGEQTRVILATDGDFNVGLSDTESLKRFVAEKRKQGTALSVLGFGRGNYNDELMQTLAQNGQGVAAYIDTLSEARKVLVDQVVSSISMIAQDVKIQVEFNPATVAEYRLIGYETRALKTEDFKNDKVDAGDIGAGHNVTALYEITPVDSPARKFSDLRYENEHEAEKPVKGSYQGELAYVKLRYKMPGDENSQLIETAVTASSSDIPEKETLFAASVASFGQMLKGSDYLGDWTFEAVEDLARETRGEDRFGYRSEFLTLVRLAQVTER